jgi:hypothetical protein
MWEGLYHIIYQVSIRIHSFFYHSPGDIFEWNYWVYGRADLDDIKSGFQGKLNSSLE